jgi:hypothetical protein
MNERTNSRACTSCVAVEQRRQRERCHVTEYVFVVSSLHAEFLRAVIKFAVSFLFDLAPSPRSLLHETDDRNDAVPLHLPPSQQDVSGSHAPLRRAAPVKQLASKRSIRWFDFFDFHSPILIYLVLLFAMLFFLMNFEYSTAQSASAATPLSGATVRFEPIDRNCFLFFAHRLSPTTTRRTNEPTTKHSLVVGYRSSHRSSVAAPIRQAP